MAKAKSPERDAVIDAANDIRRTLGYGWYKPYGARHIEQAVCVVRQRGNKKQKSLLPKAGFAIVKKRR